MCLAAHALLQSIRRMGRWSKDAMSKSYLHYFKPDALLAVGNWPNGDYGRSFWAERMMVPVPEELVLVVFPFLTEVEQQVQRLVDAKKARASMLSIMSLLRYLAVVVVQDALELTSPSSHGDFAFDDHPVHLLLRDHETFM
jgi:hypothetical protein